MGAGKTTIGRRLAKILKRDFLDTDHEIERRTGVSIPVIFEVEGESGFRKREAAVLEELSTRPNLVLATGGGIVLREENRRALRRGFVVYLSAGLDTQLARTSRNRNRPLLSGGDPRATLEKLNAERYPWYRSEADLSFDTDQRAPAGVAEEIAAAVTQR